MTNTKKFISNLSDIDKKNLTIYWDKMNGKTAKEISDKRNMTIDFVFNAINSDEVLNLKLIKCRQLDLLENYSKGIKANEAFVLTIQAP